MVQVELRSYEMLEEENKEMKTMLRKLCHEMGNALTLLGGSIFYLEHELRVKEEETDISNVKNDYTYICRLFNNLREYNHAEAIEKSYITLKALAENINEVFEKLNAKSDMKLDIEYPSECEEDVIYADITKIRQALINVIKNSVEAMDENSSDKGKNIVVRISKEAGSIMHIEIRDNGKGIPDKNLGEIFTPMYTYGKKQGSGLGLAIVKKIIEDHSGKIKAVSAVGTGTAIHIYLPLSKKNLSYEDKE